MTNCPCCDRQLLRHLCLEGVLVLPPLLARDASVPGGLLQLIY